MSEDNADQYLAESLAATPITAQKFLSLMQRLYERGLMNHAVALQVGLDLAFRYPEYGRFIYDAINKTDEIALKVGLTNASPIQLVDKMVRDLPMEGVQDEP